MVLNMLRISRCDPWHRYSLTHSPLGSDILLRSRNKAGGCWTPLPAAELESMGNADSFPMKANAGAPAAPALLLKLRLAHHQYCLNKHIRRRSSRPSCGAAGKEQPQPGSRPSCGRSGWRARGCQRHRVPTVALPEGFPPHLWPL